MSDVERLCNANHDRRKWADELMNSEVREPNAKNRSNKDERRRRSLRTATLACAMITGAGSCFVGIGIAGQNWRTAAVGAIVATVFMISGWVLETWEEMES